MRKFSVTLTNIDGKLYWVKSKDNKVGIKIKDKNGVVAIENYSTGMQHSAHPNIDRTGSIRGMKKLYWGDCKTVNAHGYIYNISATSINNELDALALHLESDTIQLPRNGEEKIYEFSV